EFTNDPPDFIDKSLTRVVLSSFVSAFLAQKNQDREALAAWLGQDKQREIQLEFSGSIQGLVRVDDDKIVLHYRLLTIPGNLEGDLCYVNHLSCAIMGIIFGKVKNFVYGYSRKGVAYERMVPRIQDNPAYANSLLFLFSEELNNGMHPSAYFREVLLAVARKFQEKIGRHVEAIPQHRETFMRVRDYVASAIRGAPDFYSLFGRRAQARFPGDRPIPPFEEYIEACSEVLGPIRTDFYRKLTGLASLTRIPEDFDIVLCRCVRPDEFAADIYLHNISRKRKNAYFDLYDLETIANIYESVYADVRPIIVEFVKEAFLHQAAHVEKERSSAITDPIDEPAVRREAHPVHAEALFRLVDMIRKTGLHLNYRVIAQISGYLRQTRTDEQTTYLSAFDGDTHCFVAESCRVRGNFVFRDYNELLADIYLALGRDHLGYALAYGTEGEKRKARKLLEAMPDSDFPDSGEEQLVLQARFRMGDITEDRTIISRDPDDFRELPALTLMPTTPQERVCLEVSPERVPREFRHKITLADGKHIIELSCEELMQIFDSQGLMHKFSYGKLNSGLGTRWALPGQENRAKGVGTIPIFGGRSFTEVGAAHLLWARQKHQAHIPMVQLLSFFTRDDVMAEWEENDFFGLGRDTCIFYENDRNRRLRLHDGSFVKTNDRKFDFVPKGHFDGIRSLILSGTLYRLVKSGKTIMSISNVDNLAATIEPLLITMLYLSGKPVLCEVNEKQPGEPIGGSLVLWEEGRVPAGQPQLQLREGQEFGNLKDPKNPFARLMAEQPQAYRRRFGYNNTANYLFSLQDIPEMFGIGWHELEELDRRIAAADEARAKFIAQAQEGGETGQDETREKNEQIWMAIIGEWSSLIADIDRRITKNMQIFIEEKVGIIQGVRLLGQITQFFPETLFIGVPAGRSADTITRFEPQKRNIINVRQEHAKVMEAERTAFDGDQQYRLTREKKALEAELEGMEASFGRIEDKLFTQVMFARPPRGDLYELESARRARSRHAMATLEGQLSRKHVLVVVGSVGMHKSDFIEHLLTKYPDKFTVPRLTTTRPAGKGEILDKRRIFIQEDRFKREESLGRLILVRFSHGSWYGLSIAELERCFNEDKILVLDTGSDRGIELIKRQFPQAKFVLISPFPVLRAGPKLERERIAQFFTERLGGRAIELNEPALRLEEALENAALFSKREFDAVVVNDNSDEPAILAQRLHEFEEVTRNLFAQVITPLPSPIRVLVVDDNLMYRTICRDAVLSLNAENEVVEATNGEAALGVLNNPQTKPFDLLLLDFLMPGEVSALTVNRVFFGHNPKSPVVIISGARDSLTEPIRQQLKNFAATVPKPFRAKEIAEAILKILEPDPARPLPGKDMPSIQMIRSAIAGVAQYKQRVLDSQAEEVDLALMFLRRPGGERQMSERLEEISQHQGVVIGPFQGFLAAHRSCFDRKQPEVLYISNFYPEYNTLVERTATIIYEIGAILRSKPHKNMRRVAEFLQWYGYYSDTQQTSLEKLEAMFNAMTQCVVRKDRAGRITFCNAAFAKWQQMAPKDMIGKTDYDLYPKSLADKYVADDRKVMEEGITIHDTEKHELPDGKRLFVEVVKAPVPGRMGQVQGVLVMFWDVTEEVRLRESHTLQTRLAAAGEILAGLSHNIRNPLAAIAMTVESLASQLNIGDRTESSLRTIEGLVMHINRMIDNALLLVRAAEHEEVSLVSVQDLLNEVYILFSQRFKRKNVAFEINISGQDMFFFARPISLFQGIANIVNNAYDVCSPGGRVSITCSRKMLADTDFTRLTLADLPSPRNFKTGDEVVEIAIIDNGPGMHRRVQNRILDPLFTTKPQGTGLGLTSAFKTVKACDGDLELVSAEGRGAEFILRFRPASVTGPVRKIRAAEESARALDISREIAATITVLVVDDLEAPRKAIEQILTELGFKCLVAESFSRAQDLLRQHSSEVRVIVTDYHLDGGRKGTVLLSNAQQSQLINPDVLKIIVSGTTDELSIQKDVNSLGAAFIGKPFRLPQLLAPIVAHFRIRGIELCVPPAARREEPEVEYSLSREDLEQFQIIRALLHNLANCLGFLGVMEKPFADTVEIKEMLYLYLRCNALIEDVRRAIPKITGSDFAAGVKLEHQPARMIREAKANLLSLLGIFLGFDSIVKKLEHSHGEKAEVLQMCIAEIQNAAKMLKDYLGINGGSRIFPATVSADGEPNTSASATTHTPSDADGATLPISVSWLDGETKTDMAPEDQRHFIVNINGNTAVTVEGPAQGREQLRIMFSYAAENHQQQLAALTQPLNIEITIDGNLAYAAQVLGPNSLKLHPKTIRGPPEFLKITGFDELNHLLNPGTPNDEIHGQLSSHLNKNPELRYTLLYLLRSNQGLSPDEAFLGSLDIDEAEFAKRQPTIIRSLNINLMRTSLTCAPYEGYDVFIISSSTPEEAQYQKELLQRIFSGVRTDNAALDHKVLIFSTVASEVGGQLLAQITSLWQAQLQATEAGLDLNSLIKSGKIKVAFFHNGGKGERASPVTLSLHNSRGSQKIVATVIDSQGREIDLGLLSAIILNCNSFAFTNPGNAIDVFWTSQLCFGTVDFRQIKRTASPFNKMVVMADKDNIIPQELHDFGTALVDSEGTIVEFYANKQFARKTEQGGYEIIEERRGDWDKPGYRLAYDFGSFTISVDLMYALYAYWEGKGLFAKFDMAEINPEDKRDIDPHFTQPMCTLLRGIEEINHTQLAIEPEAVQRVISLTRATDRVRRRELFLQHASQILENALPPSCRQKLRKPEQRAKDETERRCIHASVRECLEFFILNRRQAFFAAPGRFASVIDLGAGSLWLTYRRAIDITNEKLYMLSDILGNIVYLDVDGAACSTQAKDIDLLNALQSRRMRGIQDESICKFEILKNDGQRIPVRLSLAQVKQGTEIEDVYIKDSIVQSAVILPGSRIVRSVVHNFFGTLDVEDCYIESSMVFFLRAVRSLVHTVISPHNLGFVQQVVTDIFRPGIRDPRFMHVGQTRIILPINYNPQGRTSIRGKSDTVRNEDVIQRGNLFSCAELRKQRVDHRQSARIEERCREQVLEVIRILLGLEEVPHGDIFGGICISAFMVNDRLVSPENLGHLDNLGFFVIIGIFVLGLIIMAIINRLLFTPVLAAHLHDRVVTRANSLVTANLYGNPARRQGQLFENYVPDSTVDLIVNGLDDASKAVIFGLRAAALTRPLNAEEIEALKEAFIILNHTAGVNIKIAYLGDKGTYIYDEYKLFKSLSRKDFLIGVMESGMELLIRRDILARRGRLFRMVDDRSILNRSTHFLSRYESKLKCLCAILGQGLALKKILPRKHHIGIEYVVTCTYGRPKGLDEALKVYTQNLELFGHKEDTTLFVLDNTPASPQAREGDRKDAFDNREVIEKYRTAGFRIRYLSREEQEYLRRRYVDYLLARCLPSARRLARLDQQTREDFLKSMRERFTQIVDY
ncbi:MAG: UTP--glucose-1-phosphate uridylyltransferase, partial [Bacteroidales bacterium]